MSQSIHPTDQAAKEAGAARLLDLAFHRWQTHFPVPMPEYPAHQFSESALQVGHFKEDIPSDPPSTDPNPNREKGAKAYLRVERDMSQAGFRWCDAEGKPVDKNYIQITEGLDIGLLKEDLADMYNIHERRLVAKWNEDVKVATLRRAIQRFEAAGPSEVAAVRNEDYL
ncbi:uncharacterized protein FFB20_07469 [Fusarium fujikuroi]|uniref:Uncharacterized protein n=2 Tax=Fusarium fujikuroi TaxID=5127 RepID=S0E848_GIBF5|nr:uncharacterized protein FFUJ_08901 [Fusarium fujikuroi IMI 58289]KLP10546.1 uncharacterized protein Y057_3753 [Fusarium fujikuroi]QGI66778.1 hypothetical protein CEK27_010749 [Fusarium fujikuroi]QGI84015.1 hypothetical protein CEK25_010744 [Fusarium fujikuroi]QGI97664.1 hypothetical protein CEK26_010733 [Fusarium fujikuroi]CCT71059.1 uncharacterized protein FFUJ_08901 [Fusarium fujikuroi IMI 58289]